MAQFWGVVAQLGCGGSMVAHLTVILPGLRIRIWSNPDLFGRIRIIIIIDKMWITVRCSLGVGVGNQRGPAG